MRSSLLESIVNDMREDDAREDFINGIHERTGVSVKSLEEAYSRGLKEGADTSSPVTFAKAAVFRLTEAKETVHESEGPFRIWDRKDKTWVGKAYNNRRRASNRVDRLDNEYGAYRYAVKYVHPDDINKEISPAERAALDAATNEGNKKMKKDAPTPRNMALLHNLNGVGGAGGHKSKKDYGRKPKHRNREEY